MKWKKLRQIFEFEKSPFKQRFVSHAQSPQALVFDDFIRVYFTTRIQDSERTFISIPQFVDYTKDFSRIINFSKDEIISRGKPGCFDEHGIFPFSPVMMDGTICAFTSGWTRRVSVDVDSGIGFAVSEDKGNTFKRIGDGPVLSASLYEPFLVSDPFVRKFKGVYYMFYIFGKLWSNTHPPERVYKIAYAISIDGLTWTKANRCVVPDKIDENECQALPTVIELDGKYHMYFCYRHMAGFRTDPSKGYRLGYAYSSDLIDWDRNDEAGGIALSASGWDSEMACYPNVFENEGSVYMLYNGNHFGKESFGLTVLEGV